MPLISVAHDEFIDSHEPEPSVSAPKHGQVLERTVFHVDSMFPNEGVSLVVE